jgi:hypothetical protein
MSADSETASYTSATALWDSDRQPCPIRRRASMTRGTLMADRPGRISTLRFVPAVRALPRSIKMPYSADLAEIFGLDNPHQQQG